jgi:hypothetical protein
VLIPKSAFTSRPSGERKQWRISRRGGRHLPDANVREPDFATN